MIDEYNKTHGVLTEPSLQEREQGIGKRNDGPGMEEEMKEESALVGRPIHTTIGIDTDTLVYLYNFLKLSDYHSLGR